MPQLAKGMAQAAELVRKFNGLAHVRIPGVVKWRYTFENDWSGDPAIFFWVTRTDEASKPANLRRRRMKDASKKIAGKDFRNSDPAMVGHLRTVAAAFVNMQQYRHAADYSYATKWAKTEVQDHIATVTKAFASWQILRDEKIALDYLISLLVKERRE